MSTPLIPEDSIDALIASRLPASLKTANLDRLRALHQALRQQQRAQEHLLQLRGQVSALDAFAEPLLVAALEQATGIVIDVRQATLLRVWRTLVPGLAPTLSQRWSNHSSRQSLLAAALHNFHLDDTDAETLLPASRLIDLDGASLAMRPEVFATVCRSLDLGARYQAHLKNHWLPSDPQQRQVLNASLEEVLRANFEAAVRLAALHGQIDERSYLQLLPLISATPIVPAHPAVLRPRQLYLLGKAMVGVVTLEVRRDASAQAALDGVIAWIPGDAQAEVSRHASWEALYQHLGLRMRQPDYPAFFRRFVAQADQAAFIVRLAGLLAVPGSRPIELDGRDLAIDSPLFSYLRQAQVNKVLADARALAVPTDDEDRGERQARLKAWEEAGLDVLNLAAFFVPGPGLAMLGLAALQITQEVYAGYQDWRLGDREGALQHLFGVAENLAVGVMVGVTAGGVGKALTRLGFVDGLVPIPAPGSAQGVRLCSPALEGYALPAAPGQVGQVLGEEGARYLNLHNGTFGVHRSQQGRGWLLRHPKGGQAPSLALRSNGAGGWRHDLDLAHEWQGEALLLQRLGSALEGISEAQARPLLLGIGYDAERLRRLHLEDAAPPARLLDAWERQRLSETEPTLEGVAFEQRIDQQQAAPDAAQQALRRNFPGLTLRCAKEILLQASSRQFDALQSTGKVPLALAERARWALRDSRLDRACAGLSQPRLLNADGEVLSLALADQLAPWREHIALELRDRTADGVLLARQGDATASEVRIIVRSAGAYQAMDSEGQALATATLADSLPQALLLHMEADQRAALASTGQRSELFAQALATRAVDQREALGGLLGMAPIGMGIRPPQRLGDGRLGYPLSGRGESAEQALRRGLQQVFPTLDAEQVDAYLRALRAARTPLWAHVGALQQQLAALREALQAWQSGAGVLQRYRRWRVAREIRAVWQRQRPTVEGRHTLVIQGEQVNVLPTLPMQVSFPHVNHLVLRDLGLTSLDPSWLQHFPNLRSLDLSENQLVALPEGLEHLPLLSSLHLGRNRIVIGPAQSGRLSRLRNLRELDLSHNPIGSLPGLDGLTRLHRLALRDAGLATIPDSVLKHPGLGVVDLRDNQITEVSESMSARYSDRMARLMLHDNPLSTVSETRWQAVVAAFAHVQVGAQALDIWLTGLTGAERSRYAAVWQRLSDEQGAQAADFFRYLRDLGNSNDYRQQTSLLRQRVWMIVEACEQHQVVRETVFQQMQARGCADQVLLILSELEIRARVAQQLAEHQGAQAERGLLRLGRSLYRLDEVNRIAAEHVADEVPFEPEDIVDEVEIYMAYRVGLARVLELPGQPAYSHYAQHSSVSRNDLRRARTQILAGETREALSASLAQREFWQEHLRRAEPQAFEGSDAPFHQRLEALEQSAEQAEQAYLSQVEALLAERNAAEQRLILRLTREAYARHPF